jgi:hypothetical protein
MIETIYCVPYKQFLKQQKNRNIPAVLSLKGRISRLYGIAIVITYQDTEHYERTRIITAFTVAVSQEGKNLCFTTIYIDFRHSQRQVNNFRSVCFHYKLPYS